MLAKRWWTNDQRFIINAGYGLHSLKSPSTIAQNFLMLPPKISHFRSVRQIMTLNGAFSGKSALIGNCQKKLNLIR